MNNVSVLFSSMASFSDFGDAPDPKVAAGLSLFVILVVAAAWILTLYIAYLIVRAGVRAGVQVLIDQGRVNRELMQAQNAILTQLVKGGIPTPSASASADDGAAWDKLRNQ